MYLMSLAVENSVVSSPPYCPGTWPGHWNSATAGLSGRRSPIGGRSPFLTASAKKGGS